MYPLRKGKSKRVSGEGGVSPTCEGKAGPGHHLLPLPRSEGGCQLRKTEGILVRIFTVLEVTFCAQLPTFSGGSVVVSLDKQIKERRRDVMMENGL